MNDIVIAFIPYLLVGLLGYLTMYAVLGAWRKQGFERRVCFKFRSDRVVGFILLLVGMGLWCSAIVGGVALAQYVKSNTASSEAIDKIPWMPEFMLLAMITAGGILYFVMASRRLWFTYSKEEKDVLNAWGKEAEKKEQAWLSSHGMGWLNRLAAYKEIT